ncbi:MAG: NAD(P)/FAD-dependent oxidoreductase [Desulfovibrionaceae bacterium]|nr:NAD(P)/FAD-dependent oxidoreductase [Desulfovibrionaceae bacterium]
MQYLIIGNGVAAIGAVEGIRSRDKSGAITIVSEEEVPTYGRPLISYYLADKIRLETLPFRPESFYTDNKVRLRLGARALSVDPEAGRVVLEDGQALAYDRLLLATGGEPLSPDLPGIDGPGVHHFTTVAHAEALRGLVGKVREVAVIGAGLIALKAAEGLAGRDVRVTLIVRSRIMRAYFDDQAGDMVVRHLEAQGLNFLQGAEPRAIVRDEAGELRAVDTDKGLVPAQAVIIAAGVKPRAGLARDCGIRVDRGIRVDDCMRTSAEDVFAAGDVAEAKDLLTGEYTVRPIWPNAYNQGLYAGYNMAGPSRPYSGGLAMNAVTYYGLPTIAVGQANPAPGPDFEVHSHLDAEASVYRKLVFRDQVLVGFILIGDIDAAGFYTSFVRNRFRLDPEAKRLLIEGRPSPALWPEEYKRKMEQNP